MHHFCGYYTTALTKFIESCAGTAKNLTHSPPVLSILQRTHGAGPQRVHFITNIDWIVFQNRLTVSNHSSMALNEEYSPYVWAGESGRLTHTYTHSETGPPGDWYMGLTGEQRGIKRSKGGARKKEKCLLNDIPIVSLSRTMALCKTANNEHRRNPLSYRGPAACLPLP